MPADVVPIRFRNRDGLTLAGRDYPAAGSARLPVLCLPGLTRNSRDFETLATALAGHPEQPRRVIALDFRGRGESDWDPEPARYTPQTELQDTLDILDSLGVQRVIAIGTSRGGLVTMTMALLAPDRLAGAVLNDIGPVLELGGLLRIKSYVGVGPPPRSWAEATEAVRRINALYFPRLGEPDWERFARRVFRERDGIPQPGSDPRLADGLAALTEETVPPPLWPAFEPLARVPTLVIRGALTDLVSRETLADMARRHPRIETCEVADEGHAPLLEDGPTIARITAFLARADAVA